MTKYEVFMKLLHEKGCVKSMQKATNMIPLPDELPDGLKAAIMKGCVGQAVHTVLKTDPEIKVAFDEAACELMLDAIAKDLDLKKDENFKPTPLDELFKSIAEKMAAELFK